MVDEFHKRIPRTNFAGALTGPEAAHAQGIKTGPSEYNRQYVKDALPGVKFNAPRETWKQGESTMSMAPQIAPQAKQLQDILQKRGVQFHKDSGAFNPQSMLPSGKPSAHAHATAFDLNPSENPFTKEGKNKLPPDVAKLAQSHGFFWAGSWSDKKDTMHFEAQRVLSPEQLKEAAKPTHPSTFRVVQGSQVAALPQRAPSAIKPEPNIQIAAKTEAIKKAGLKSSESAPSIQEHHHHYQTTATTHSGPESAKSAIPQQHATLHHASKSNPRTWVDN